MWNLPRSLYLTFLVWSCASLAQGSCGLFDPKITFRDGSKSCLSEFSFFSRKGIISSPDFGDHVAVAKTHATSYAIATPASPQSCPFVQYTAWDWLGQDAKEALSKCNTRMQEAAKRNSEFSKCGCEVLVDSGFSRLTRPELVSRLSAFEHFITTGKTQHQTDRDRALER